MLILFVRNNMNLIYLSKSIAFLQQENLYIFFNNAIKCEIYTLIMCVTCSKFCSLLTIQNLRGTNDVWMKLNAAH